MKEKFIASVTVELETKKKVTITLVERTEDKALLVEYTADSNHKELHDAIPRILATILKVLSNKTAKKCIDEVTGKGCKCKDNKEGVH